MPIAVKELFDSAAKDDEHDWRFGVTYVEIYNERVKDLLNPEVELEVREDARKGTHIQGAVEVAVGTVQEPAEHMGAGRSTASPRRPTATPSRRAARRAQVGEALQKFGDGGEIKRLSKLSMIDLAGSERAYKTDTGQRLVEGRASTARCSRWPTASTRSPTRRRRGSTCCTATASSRGAARLSRALLSRR